MVWIWFLWVYFLCCTGINLWEVKLMAMGGRWWERRIRNRMSWNIFYHFYLIWEHHQKHHKLSNNSTSFIYSSILNIFYSQQIGLPSPSAFHCNFIFLILWFICSIFLFICLISCNHVYTCILQMRYYLYIVVMQRSEKHLTFYNSTYFV